MPKVLIVDDEPEYREELALALERRGLQLQTAASARHAIDVGLRFAPDVLVTDWLLESHIHGLSVFEALGVAHDNLRCILMTGFASSDLRREARKHRVCDFVEKPFDVQRIEQAVAAALSATPPPTDLKLPIGVVVVSASGAILHANAQARALFAESPGAGDAVTLEQLVGAGAGDLLASAKGRWTEWPAPDPATGPRRVYARVWPDGVHMLLVTASDKAHLRNHPLVRLLLDLAEPPPVRWPFDDHALIVDDFDMVRQTVCAQLQHTGCLCHATESVRTALRLFRRDPRIRYVILDHDMPEVPTGHLVEELRRERPDVVIVGCSGTPHGDEFAAMGVELFLPKPFTPWDLINILTGRFGNCVDCGLPIPLRRPRSGESGTSWECAGCGSRYHAILDETFPPNVVSHVRRPAAR